eukprot:m.98068 g.98068  ORF g.98068 m.98068 type:complete len:170 (+) comp13623_c0_seq2:811-1320(+)
MNGIFNISSDFITENNTILKIYKNYMCQCFRRPPGGREKPFHQDAAYFNVDVNEPIGVWVSLTKTTKDNGAMFLIPGKHNEPIPHFKRRDWQICDTTITNRKEKCVMASMNPGDVLIFSGLLPHGTPTNVSKDQRFALQYHYLPKRAVILPDDTLRLGIFGGEGLGAEC